MPSSSLGVILAAVSGQLVADVAHLPSLFRGLVIGFAVAAPVGPVGLLCIRRSIADGHLAGFITGLGAAAADALFGLIAALGLTAVTSFLTGHAHAFHFSSGLFLLAFGIATIRSRP